MRVVIVSGFPPWPMTDGNRLILDHQLRVLSRRHAITVIAAGRHPGDVVPDTDALDGVTFRWFGARRTGLPEYARRRWRGLVTREPADVFRVDAGGLVDEVDRVLRDDPPDVVYLIGPGTAFLAGRARRAGVPVVHMAIDAWRESYGLHELLPRWRRLIESTQRRAVRRHELRHLPSCDAVVVVAERDAEALRAAIPGLRVEVVPNGVDPGPEPVRPDDPGPVLGLHGTMATLPNRTAAAALADGVLPIVQRSVPDARVRIIGRDPAPDVLRLRRHDVEVTGAVADVAGELATLAVYVVAMSEGSGIKNKVLEAMAAELPVVATPRAVDGIGAGPGNVVADDHEGLAAAAVALLQDPTARDECGRAGRRRVCDEFRWETSVAAIEGVWHGVAGAARSGHGGS